MVWPLTRLPMGTVMVIAQPAPFVSAFIDAVDQAIREQSPSHGMSAMQRAWLAFCVTAVLVTNSICWARFARASVGTYSLAALSRMFRHSKIPWDELLVASVRIILSLLVDQGLFFHPDQHARLNHHLPGYTVGSLRTNVQVEGLVNVTETLMSSTDPQGQLHRFTHALHDRFAFGHSKRHMIQRQLGRLE